MTALPHLRPTTLPERSVEVGRVGEAWGIKGWVHLHPHSNDPTVLLETPTWFLAPPQGIHARGFDAFSQPVAVQVLEVKSHGAGLVARIEGIDSRNAAEALRKACIYVPRNAFPPPDSDDEFYWVDLLGLQVLNREGLQLGKVVDLMPTGAHSVLVLAYDHDGEAAERMIPFVSVYVDKVDMDAGQILVDWQPDY